ncbi:very short patch repair endonuclease [Micromonospora pisi]
MSLRLYRRTRRIRAYLRWSDQGVTQERYVGEVTQATRAENLQEAWRKAHATGMLSPPMRANKPTADPTRESWASSLATRAVMRSNRSRDTKPELLLRSRLHAMGLRYRVNYRPMSGLRRTADLVFSTARVAVFVDGCYWHGCPEHHRPARTNSDFWRTKIDRNKQRDAETDRLLAESGWRVIRIWEHVAPDDAAQAVAEVIRSRQR